MALLKSGLRGVLSVLGDDGYPYGIPTTIEHEIGKAGPATLMFALVPEHTTSKLVNKSFVSKKLDKMSQSRVFTIVSSHIPSNRLFSSKRWGV